MERRSPNRRDDRCFEPHQIRSSALRNYLSHPIKIVPPIRLKDFDPGFHGKLDKETAREKTTKLCERIGELQHLLYANANYSVLIVLQGMDASGKDGASKRVLQFVNPAGVDA